MSWTTQTSGTIVDLAGVSFVDAANGWAVGGGGLDSHPDNGGTDWSTQASGTTFGPPGGVVPERQLRMCGGIQRHDSQRQRTEDRRGGPSGPSVAGIG